MVELGVATTTEEREAVFRFWYSVYVTEMGRYARVADHERKQLRDPEDDRTLIFYARDGAEVVASCRFTWGGDGFSERQVTQYSLEPFLREMPAETLLVGERTMVAAAYRGGTLWTDLALTTTQPIHDLGVLLSFGACEPHLVSFYAQFGQRPYARRHFFSEESGYLIPNVAFTEGIEAFGTPLPSCVQRILDGDAAVYSAALNGEEPYRVRLRDALSKLDLSVTLFADMTEEEIDRCCDRSTLIECSAGDQILKQGGTARNPFMVIGGELRATRPSAPAQRLGPGDLFGESGWIASTRRTCDVSVTEDGATLLVLSERTLQKLDETAPATAFKLLHNTTRTLWRRLHDSGHTTG